MIRFVATRRRNDHSCEGDFSKKYVVQLSGEEREQLRRLFERKEPGTARAKGPILLRLTCRKPVKAGATAIIKALTPTFPWFSGCGSNWRRKASGRC